MEEIMTPVQLGQKLENDLKSLQEIVLPHSYQVDGDVLGTVKDNLWFQKLHTLRVFYFEELIALKGGLELKDNTQEMKLQAKILMELAELTDNKLTAEIHRMYGDQTGKKIVVCSGNEWQIVAITGDNNKHQCSCRGCVVLNLSELMWITNNVNTMIRVVTVK
jgi:hypothetical protein